MSHSVSQIPDVEASMVTISIFLLEIKVLRQRALQSRPGFTHVAAGESGDNSLHLNIQAPEPYAGTSPGCLAP